MDLLTIGFLMGKIGMNAYDLWLEQGNVGSLQDFFEAYRGPIGPIGPIGPKGETGNVGEIKIVARTTLKTNEIKANGAELSTEIYPELFEAIGYTFGGEGDTFRLPDLRGEFIRGFDDGRGIDSGRELGSYQLDQMQKIEGSFSWERMASTSHPSSDTTGAFSARSNFRSKIAQSGTSGSTSFGIDFDSSKVARTGEETRARNIALMAVIVYR